MVVAGGIARRQAGSPGMRGTRVLSGRRAAGRRRAGRTRPGAKSDADFPGAADQPGPAGRQCCSRRDGPGALAAGHPAVGRTGHRAAARGGVPCRDDRRHRSAADPGTGRAAGAGAGCRAAPGSAGALGGDRTNRQRPARRAVDRPCAGNPARRCRRARRSRNRRGYPRCDRPGWDQPGHANARCAGRTPRPAGALGDEGRCGVARAG